MIPSKFGAKALGHWGTEALRNGKTSLVFVGVFFLMGTGWCEERCFKYTGEGEDSMAWITTDWIKVEGGKEYDLAAKIKHADFAMRKGFFVVDGWCYRGKEVIKGGFGEKKIVSGRGTRGWHIMRTKVLIPAEADQLKIALQASGMGRVWARDIYFARTDSGDNLIANADFEDFDGQAQKPRGWLLGVYKGPPIAPSRIEWND
ncbi:MAG: hypothetical protein PHV34_05430 [Verrucomicrobiae bacterium]|nr:hypothetical protein [Verrucomicrobiae bacterium]